MGEEQALAAVQPFDLCHILCCQGEIEQVKILLRTELGFWDVLCREKMPPSKFLVQTDESVFEELVKVFSLPCFTTDYGMRHGWRASCSAARGADFESPSTKPLQKFLILL